MLSRTQAEPGRTVKQEHEEISRNHIQTLFTSLYLHSEVKISTFPRTATEVFLALTPDILPDITKSLITFLPLFDDLSIQNYSKKFPKVVEPEPSVFICLDQTLKDCKVFSFRLTQAVSTYASLVLRLLKC